MILPVDIKTKFYSQKIKAKNSSRILSVQSLYAYDIWKHYGVVDVSQLILDILDIHQCSKTKQLDNKYFVKIVKGTIQNVDLIDGKISLYLNQDWKVERLPKLIKAMLRVAIYELINTTEVSNITVIDEYLKIAKIFDHHGEVGFINSVLDNFMRAAT